MRTLLRSAAVALLAALALAVQPGTGRADFFQVTLDTSQLSGSYTYAIDFTLAAGGPNTNNTATITGLTLGGGSAGALLAGEPVGHVSGDLQNLPITLFEDQGGFADLAQEFTPGSQIQFTVDVTDNPQLNGNLDQFTFALLYLDPAGSGNFFNIPTDNPNFNDAFVEIDTGGSGPPSGIGSQSTDQADFPIPQAEVQATAVPEPSAVILFLLGGATIALGRWRRRRCAADLSQDHPWEGECGSPQ